MGKITRLGKSASTPDGGKIIDACKKLGVPFSCEVGTCGVCAIDIKKGSENLSPLTQEEKDLGCTKTHRLACQCKLIKGELEIE